MAAWLAGGVTKGKINTRNAEQKNGELGRLGGHRQRLRLYSLIIEKIFRVQMLIHIIYSFREGNLVDILRN